MSNWELVVLAFGLSMDAFAVSVCRGLTLRQPTWKHSVEAGLYFGGFQGLMPLIGYFLGYRFAESIAKYDHWIAFILLGFIGGNMIKEAFAEEGCSDQSMLTLAIATSIDALAVGVTFAFLKINIYFATGTIAIITAVCSGVGVQLGAKAGGYLRGKAEIFGGIILIGIGLKILLEHTILQ